MTEDQALVPVEERTILFYDDEIKGVRVTRTPLLTIRGTIEIHE